MNAVSQAFDLLATWAQDWVAAQWLLIGLVLLVLAVRFAYLFADCCLHVQALFAHHGVGHDEKADLHQRTWPEYWE